MKKQLAICIAILTMLSISGCDTVSPTKNAPSKQGTSQETDKATQDKATNAAQKAVVCEIPGLGDTISAWSKEFGDPTAQGSTIKVFKNGDFKTVFDNDKAITITFISKNSKNPLVEKMLPKDGQKLSESNKKTGELNMIVQKWHSALLESAMPDTKGNYTIMQNIEGTAYRYVVVDCTPNLSK